MNISKFGVSSRLLLYLFPIYIYLFYSCCISIILFYTSSCKINRLSLKFRIQIIHQPCTCPRMTQARSIDMIYEAVHLFMRAKRRGKEYFKNLYFLKKYSLPTALIPYYLAREDRMGFGPRQGSTNSSDYLVSMTKVVLESLGLRGKKWNCFWKRRTLSYPTGWLLEASGVILKVIVIL